MLLYLFPVVSKCYISQYEAAERKRRAAREAAGGTDSGAASGGGGGGRGLRREVWVRPSGGRTTTLRHDTRDQYLATMTSVEVFKNTTILICLKLVPFI